MRSKTNVIQTALSIAGVLILMALAGCGKPFPQKNQPISFWADIKNDPGTPCVAATAQAIMKSGLPYPNIKSEEVIQADGTMKMQAKTIDVWVGPTRFVLPYGLVKKDGSYDSNHPRRFWGLWGSLPNFYPVGKPGPVVDGMGSMVDITFICSVKPESVASWDKAGYLSNEDWINATRQRYEQELKDSPNYPGTVTVSIREDLGMTEVLKTVYGHSAWAASYLPLNHELKSLSGRILGIGCYNRHDPQKGYGGVGWRCGTSIDITPEMGAYIEIYVSQIQHMPAIHEQVKQLLINAKQN